MKKEDETKKRIMIYGIDHKGYPATHSFELFGYEIFFEPFDTDEKFQDYEGVVMFSGIWSNINQPSYGEFEAVESNKHSGELKSRVKQSQQLFEKHGFMCFLVDDLTIKKYDLVHFFMRKFGSIYTHQTNSSYLSSLVNEFIAYIKDYGVAHTKFEYSGDGDYRKLIKSSDGDCVGFVPDKKIYVLPYHQPKKDEARLIEHSIALLKCLIPFAKRYNEQIPEWATKFEFTPEKSLKKQKQTLSKEVLGIDDELSVFEKYKRVLVLTGDLLKEAVADMLKEAFCFKVDKKDELIEDIKIMLGKEIGVLIEVKGINGNISNEAINQADSHRERNNFDENFPSVVIANTAIKNAKSTLTKDAKIDEKQIRHAIKMSVLLVRTLDLLRYYDLILKGTKKKDDLLDLFRKETGWLEVTQGGEVILHNEKKERENVVENA